MQSFDQSIDAMHSILVDLEADSNHAARNLPNRDLDTGREVQPGAYRLTDKTSQSLLERLTRTPTHPVPLPFRDSIAAYFSKAADSGTQLTSTQWQTIREDLTEMHNLPAPACDYDKQAPGSTPCFVASSSKETGMFFDSWQGLLRVLIVSVCAYAALVLKLRISGKRS